MLSDLDSSPPPATWMLDGATAEANDAVRGPGSYDTALHAMADLHDAASTTGWSVTGNRC